MRALLIIICLVHAANAQTAWRNWGKYHDKSVQAKSVYRTKNISVFWIRVKTNHDISLGRFAFNCMTGDVKQIEVFDKTGIYGSWDGFESVKPGTFGGWLHSRACP